MIGPRLLVFPRLAGCALALGGLPLWGLSPPERIVEGPTVVLPDLVVTAENYRFEGWHKTSSAHFTLYGDGDAAAARTLLAKLERLNSGLEHLTGQPPVVAKPLLLVSPGEHSDWTALEDRAGREEWKRNMVVWMLDYHLVNLWIYRPAATLSPLWRMLGANDYRSSAWAVGGNFLSNHNLPGSMWADRGLSLLSAESEVSASTVGFGRASQFESGHSGEIGTIPWERFFSLPPNPPEYQQTKTVGLLDAQCSLVMRRLLASTYTPPRERFREWLFHLREGNPPTEAKFRELFGWDWAAWTKLLRGSNQWRPFLNPSAVTVTLEPAERVPVVEQSEVTPAEMREVFLLGRVLGTEPDQRSEVLDHFLKRGLRSKELRIILASACLRASRPADALPLLLELCREGTRNPAVPVAAARILFDQSAGRITVSARLEKDAGQVRDLCRQVLALNPDSVEANEILAWALALDTALDAEGLRELQAIEARLTPYRHMRAARAAQAVAAARLGDLALATRLCRGVLAETVPGDLAGEVCRELMGEVPAER